MFDNSGNDYISEYINQTIPLEGNNQTELKNISIKKIEMLLENLKKAKDINCLMQNSIINKITESQQKMSKIESLLEKINSIKKSKPKKHMKYPNYIPLDSFYIYTPKKTHLYYHLLERVFESGKKELEKEENGTSSDQKIKTNRYNFSKQHDNSLNNIIFLNEKDNVINWYKVSAEMNNIFHNNNNKNNSNNNNNNNNNINFLIGEKKINQNDNNSIITIKDSEEEEEINLNDQDNNKENKRTKKRPKKEKKSKKEEKKEKKEKEEKHDKQEKDTIKIFTPLSCYVRYLETTSFYKYKKWNKEEDQILRRAILYYGPKNWQQISYCLDGRNNSQCFHRWMKGINPKIRRDKWSFEEDLTLGLALNKIYQKKKWSKIANHLLGRTDIQCRERWCNILDPSLEEVEWTNEEDLKLLNLYRKYGNKWSLIAKHYGNRTDNTCWRRWKYLTCTSLSKNYSDTYSGMSKFIVNKNNNGNYEKNGGISGEASESYGKKMFKVVNFGKE